jgi:hypothetical protein
LGVKNWGDQKRAVDSILDRLSILFVAVTAGNLVRYGREDWAHGRPGSGERNDFPASHGGFGDIGPHEAEPGRARKASASCGLYRASRERLLSAGGTDFISSSTRRSGGWESSEEKRRERVAALPRGANVTQRAYFPPPPRETILPCGHTDLVRAGTKHLATRAGRLSPLLLTEAQLHARAVPRHLRYRRHALNGCVLFDYPFNCAPQLGSLEKIEDKLFTSKLKNACWLAAVSRFRSELMYHVCQSTPGV